MSTQRIILITGANSGVGYAATQVLVESSPDIHVIMSGRTLSKVQTAKSEIEASGTNIKGTLSALQLDITDDSSIARAVRHVESTHGRLDVLVNNAALGNRAPDLRTRLTQCFETNALGSALVAAAFRPLLLKSANPYSVFVSSGVSIMASTAAGAHKIDHDDAYRMSKAALNMIAMVEHRDYSPLGLKVICMCPGFVVSNLRGTSEEARNPGGMAQDPRVSGELILGIVNGERDRDVGVLIHKDGVYAW